MLECSEDKIIEGLSQSVEEDLSFLNLELSFEIFVKDIKFNGFIKLDLVNREVLKLDHDKLFIEDYSSVLFTFLSIKLLILHYYNLRVINDVNGYWVDKWWDLQRDFSQLKFLVVVSLV